MEIDILKDIQDKSSITFELHFWVVWHEIRWTTRNRCSDDLIRMVYETALILYPDEEFEVYFYPAQPGSYADIAKIVKKNSGAIIIWTATVGACVFAWLTWHDSHQEHVNNQNIQILENATQKCPEFKKKLEEMKKSGLEIDEVGEDALKAICENVRITKSKNDYWQTLHQDDMVQYDEIILKNSSNSPITSKRVNNQDFSKYIEYVPENEEYWKDDFTWIIELISPVFRQKKWWKWTPWKGIYYWEDIKERGVNILQDGEEIQFYMQDNEFKKEITEWKRAFQAGDNLKVKFGIKGLLNMNYLIIQNRKIYVSLVEALNEDIVEHKEKLEIKKRNKNLENKLQLPLFS